MRRNKSQGWSHAKNSGHKNENLVSDLLLNNISYQEQILMKLGFDKNIYLRKNVVNGLNEKQVETILGGKAYSKTDLKLYLSNDMIINISLKKSDAGQVYLITKNNFINGFEKIFNKIIPNNVKIGINLFWSGKNDRDLYGIINENSPYPYNIKQHELNHNRLHSETLKSYNQNIHDALIAWFKDNIFEITLFCFSYGLSKETKEHSKYIWYKNLIKSDNLQDMDYIFDIKTLALCCNKKNNDINYSSKNGSTITLPFGFVQWHKNSLQFHHQLKEILKIYS
ncbi:hypothetical protein CBLAS_0554 [Campylobacter blaseri]|uniref:Uncharacterized protein n=1 Tax=Campylobacter blaseri TaxID=2042961 RepID=A0A2P8R085_9BACT|nr:hypothetical protein [Campylobacter blaseri]PSM51915.1 hypothetical protein CQ405_04945 [Campylobacter blaseri]PSM53699.1 hypothetical protein CRN67_04945 [Campylobacter blaseri]QKF85747.1 hypothetical protein CBLAS_0554 [Campylobacter blaseri]